MEKVDSTGAHLCLICGKVMSEDHNIIYSDYYCNAADDHHLSYRRINHKIVMLRVRLSNGDEHLRLKIYYQFGYSEVWTTPKSQRIKINQIIPLNFNDLDILRNKIKVCLLFS